MRQNTRTTIGILFLILSFSAISLFRINPTTTTPTRSTQVRNAGIMKGLTRQLVIVQEFTATKEYLSGIDLMFTHGGRNNTNENTLLLLDNSYKPLYKQNFPSTMVKEGDLTSFLFDKSIYIGQGNHLFLCLFSGDGTDDNTISPLFNTSDSIGSLSISRVKDGDFAGSAGAREFNVHGSLMLRTYETNSSQFWLMKAFLYLLAVIVACLIIWLPWVRAELARHNFAPQWIFVVIALPFSMIFTFITPPLQVPDEGSHFIKSYSIAEFKSFDAIKTSPVSLVKLDSTFGYLHFSAGKKTTAAEITKQLGKKLEPSIRVTSSPPAYTVPYLPQSIGIFIGRIFGASPLVLMYLGRLFNLLISILIVFQAIRIIPQFKWILLLLALMPKTLFLFGSLSYDSLTISLSFFAIALFFYYAYACERNLNLKDLALMALVMLLLLFCKPPYFILGGLLFFIPPKKFGYLYKYIMISVGVVVLALIIFKVGPAAMSYFSASDAALTMQSPGPSTSTAQLPVIRPEEQIQIIKNDIPAYLRLIVKSSFDINRSYILTSFVGLLGWVDVALPVMLTYSYLFLILLTSLVLSGSNVTLGIAKKSLLLFLLVVAFVVIETAMYVYATRPGRDQVFGVQGRYFIPMAPLFFMLFYNNYFNPGLNLLFSMRRNDYKNAKVKVKPVIFQEIQDGEQLFNKSLYVFLTFYCFFTLLYSVYITLIRYYNI